MQSQLVNTGQQHSSCPQRQRQQRPVCTSEKKNEASISTEGPGPLPLSQRYNRKAGVEQELLRAEGA